MKINYFVIKHSIITQFIQIVYLYKKKVINIYGLIGCSVSWALLLLNMRVAVVLKSFYIQCGCHDLYHSNIVVVCHVTGAL